MGTGAGGLTAALAAHHEGASVIVLEKSSVIGGTTAVSGGVIWIPNNHHMTEVGCSDSRDDALTYIRRIADGKSDDALIERYVDAGPEMVRWVEAHADVRFESLGTYPDYHPELPGGRAGGRSLDNGLFDTNVLGEWKARLRKNPTTGRVPITIGEAMAWGVFWNPLGAPMKDVIARSKAGIVHGGAGLCGKLLRALLDVGIEPLMDTAGDELVLDDAGAVTGLVARTSAGSIRIRAKKGVIFASGGFEWNEALCRDFLAPELRHPVSPPSNTGDSLRMAMGIGAELGAMNECWWSPAVDIPGELYDGTQLHRCEFSVRCLPHSIIVNRRGRRFTNESGNYNDMTKPFFDHDSVAYERRNLPAWLVVDSQYLERYVFVTAMAGRPIPDYITEAESLEALALKLGIDAAGLVATVSRFNGFVVSGIDEDFQRGECAFDRFYGDPRQKPNPNLGTIEKGPFYALPIHPGAMGTKGGPKTTVDGEVKRVGGVPVPGLYACGNAMASVMGHGYPGAGSTIGASMVFGYLAAKHAASSRA
jgi:3-oxosteroid 1-dehydrogenase